MARAVLEYPWGEWLGTAEKPRRGKLRLVHGQHFYCRLHSMIALIRAAAARRKLRVSVHVEPCKNGKDTISIQVRD